MTATDLGQALFGKSFGTMSIEQGHPPDAAPPTRRAYSPDQPRDRGRFARRDGGDTTPVDPYDARFAEKYGYDPPEGQGDCFQSAVDAAGSLEAQGKTDVRVVHGVVEGNGGDIAGVRFPHAWAEFTEQVGGHGVPMVTDKSNGNDVTAPRALYYKIGKIDEADVRRYTTTEARVQMAKTGQWGPWE